MGQVLVNRSEPSQKKQTRMVIFLGWNAFSIEAKRRG